MQICLFGADHLKGLNYPTARLEILGAKDDSDSQEISMAVPAPGSHHATGLQNLVFMYHLRGIAHRSQRAALLALRSPWSALCCATNSSRAAIDRSSSSARHC